MPRWIAGLTAAFGASLCFAGVAPAATLLPSSSPFGPAELYYYADPGEHNDVAVSNFSLPEGGRDWLVRDPGARPLRASSSEEMTCAAAGVAATCHDALDYSRWIHAQLGDGDDRVDTRGASGQLDCCRSDEWNLGDGDDRFVGGANAEAVLPGHGADTIVGGDGKDVVHYGRAPWGAEDWPVRTGVTVTLDGVADDGAPGEGDAVDPMIEEVSASTPGIDTLRGNDGGQTLIAGAGDRVSGLGGDDFLAVGSGGLAEGGPGNDVLLAIAVASGGGTLRAGPGHDDLAADGGGWQLDGGSGDDTLHSIRPHTEPNTLRCGSGSDTVVALAIDVVGADCEQVTLQ